MTYCGHEIKTFTSDVLPGEKLILLKYSISTNKNFESEDMTHTVHYDTKTYYVPEGLFHLFTESGKHILTAGYYSIDGQRWFQNLVTDDEYRNKGLMTMVCKYLISRYKISRAFCNTDNTKLINFYKKLGFREIMRFENVAFNRVIYGN